MSSQLFVVSAAGQFARFVDWSYLTTSKETQWALADSCSSCRSPGTVFYATGDYVGCQYYNRNCGMNLGLFCMLSRVLILLYFQT